MSEREWRVMRFENAEGKWAEVASNHVRPERVPVPPGYRFVSSTPMVPAARLREAVEALKEVGGYGGPLYLLEPSQGERPDPTAAAQKLRAILERYWGR